MVTLPSGRHATFLTVDARSRVVAPALLLETVCAGSQNSETALAIASSP